MMNKNIKEVGKVWMTEDYNHFGFVKGNRPISRGRKFIQLKDSLNKIGQVQPIVVNEHNEVIDGQHRLAALEELGKPVYFIVKPGTYVSHVSDANIYQDKWKVKDHIHMYSVRKNEHYQYLEKYMKTTSLAETTLLSIAMNNTYGGSVRSLTSEGKFTFNNREEVAQFDTFNRKVVTDTKLTSNSFLQMALWEIFKIKKVDLNRLIDKINSKKLHVELKNIRLQSAILEILILAYNDQLSENSKNRISFAYDNNKKIKITDELKEWAKKGAK